MNLDMEEDIDRRQERRSRVLSSADFEKMGDVFDEKMSSMFERIGYDTSTPTSRDSIRKDHEFVRQVRKAKGKIMTAVFTGIGGSLALWLWNAIAISSKAQGGP